MNIVVCIKQVPDTAEVRINPETEHSSGTAFRPSSTPMTCMRLRRTSDKGEDRRQGDCPYHGASAGRDSPEGGHSMGADERCFFLTGHLPVLIHGPRHSPFKGDRKIGADVILCGKQAIDGDTAQVGPETAEFLDIPHISYIRKIEDVSR